MEERPHKLPMWKGVFFLEEVDDHIPYVSANKIPYSSIDWVDRDIIEINSLGGKGFFYLCNNFFVVTDSVLTCV